MSQKQWINSLPPIAQAKLWNSSDMDIGVEPLTFKSNNKFELIVQYGQEIWREPDVYKDYLEFKKKQEENESEVAPDGDCIIL